MKEFMLFIRNEINSKSAFSPDNHLEFLNACKSYIHNLAREGKLITAQPLVREGKIIACLNGEWQESPFNETNEVNVGYYHILAKDLDEAIQIAKGNPA